MPMELLTTGPLHDKLLGVLWRGGVSFQWLFKDGEHFVAQFGYADTRQVDRMRHVEGIEVIGLAGVSGHNCVWFKLKESED